MFADTLFNRQRLALVVLVALFIIALPWTGTTLGLFLVLIASMWTLGVTQHPPARAGGRHDRAQWSMCC